ncbi:hypothetical protein ZHAS_00004561 [Anopheles sinensis]|uniref:Protein kinase domain-containing protein n=1 Tax=Anopheles sinensis TaxID=74873 RepID=A0A084VHI4_ANOSI|nr:hypothetical protein ZHAS_00004561 [Anopheles sinensis]
MIDEFLFYQVEKAFPPYTVRVIFHIPKAKLGPGTISCLTSEQKAEASLYVLNFHERMKFEILTPAEEIVVGRPIEVRCQVNIYNFTNQLAVRYGHAKYDATGFRFKYAWVVNYNLTVTTEDRISCSATEKTTGLVLKRTLSMNVNAPSDMVTDASIAEEIDLTEIETPIIPSEYEFSLEKLSFGGQMGEGAFGIVRTAVARDIYVHEPYTTVAVKTLKPHCAEYIVDDFIVELQTMVSIGQHLNIVNLLGAVTKNMLRRNIMIIFEHCKYGSLDVFLTTNRSRFVDCSSALEDLDNWRSPNPEGQSQETPVGEIQFNTTSLICWAAQIASGMTYLASKNILHGDLAARNILLCDANVVKISDFGLARTLYRGIYRRQGDALVPIKWIAVECFKELTFSTKTDVWSFGVLLWELFSLGETPYPGITNGTEMYNHLDNGNRLEKPSYCSAEMYEIMIRCWYVCAKLRPDFKQLAYDINEMLPDELQNYYVALNGPYMKRNVLRGIRNREEEPVVFSIAADADVFVGSP